MCTDQLYTLQLLDPRDAEIYNYQDKLFRWFRTRQIDRYDDI